MRFPRFAVFAGLLLSTGLILGCTDNTKSRMRNIQEGTGPEVEKDMPLKKGAKPMPADSPPPQPPPLPK